MLVEVEKLTIDINMEIVVVGMKSLRRTGCVSSSPQHRDTYFGARSMLMASHKAPCFLHTTFSKVMIPF